MFANDRFRKQTLRLERNNSERYTAKLCQTNAAAGKSLCAESGAEISEHQTPDIRGNSAKPPAPRPRVAVAPLYRLQTTPLQSRSASREGSSRLHAPAPSLLYYQSIRILYPNSNEFLSVSESENI